MPISDDDPHGSKLEAPISLPSISMPQDPSRYAMIRSDLKNNVTSVGLRIGGKDYRIVESLVLISPGGGKIYDPLDLVTIVPTEVQVQ
jgi:hypothetical protein